ncbi:MAG: amidohydrolase family protein, partial [Bacteroidia bacterium]|nr:amidohydrolase family protein [Bacteroidia bacterium]
MKKPVTTLKFFLMVILVGMYSCHSPVKYYTAADFEKVPKIDAHFHYLTTNGRFIEFATTQLFSLVSPNVDNVVPIDDQWDISRTILKSYPRGISFLATFDPDSFARPGFASGVIARIETSLLQGASGVKIWKNIGMELKDSAGRYVMADNPAFEPIFRYLEKNRIPLLAHLGEPRNCWLPEAQMTDDGDRSYFKDNPQYHMYLHPEMPSYQQQISARDHLLQMYPDLILVGAHLGSLEWNVDELALRFDRYPNFAVDMAARIGHLRNQSKENRERVRRFLITYQDRILYGTDMEVHDAVIRDFDQASRDIRNGWLNDWIYLATDSIVQNVQGLKLPAEVVD